ncbi:MAG: thioredoxin [Acidobacteria bacterium]|nr:thioredoxin [Acidobacteriota bacterium]
MSEYVGEVNDENFEKEVLQASTPVLVDFWAEWCGPCIALGPTVEAVAQDYQGKAKVVKLNVDFSQQVAPRLGIRGIPTLILFQSGNEAERIIGMTSKDKIAQMIDKALGV